MKIRAREPDFSLATIRLGNEVHAQLVRASRKARNQWSVAFQHNPELAPRILDLIRQSRRTVNFPIVESFMWEWAQNLEWPIYQPDCTDAIGVKVPDELITALQAYGTVESFEFLLADMAQPASASLGNNDHDFKFRLFINCPTWISVASVNEYADSFEKQLGVVIQHEMAHFRHQKTELDSEFAAHSRGVAWALSKDDLPPTKDATIELLQEKHPDVWYNNEVKLLFSQKDQSAYRFGIGGLDSVLRPFDSVYGSRFEKKHPICN